MAIHVVEFGIDIFIRIFVAEEVRAFNRLSGEARTLADVIEYWSAHAENLPFSPNEHSPKQLL